MDFNIVEFGAAPGGETEATAAIQRAIDACAGIGGGRVVVPNGVWLIYTLFLKSGVELHLEPNAVLLGGEDPLKYPEVPDSDVWIVRRTMRGNRRAVLYAAGAENVAITGRGKLVCRGKSFMRVEREDETFPLHTVWRRKDDRLLPGRTLWFAGCRDVRIEDLTVLDSAGWATWFLDCDRVNIHRMRIDQDMRIPNGDGLHISSCRDVAVRDCFLRCSDDAIVLRSHQEQLYEPKPCERVTVTNCTLQSGSAAVRIGHTHDYAVRDCMLSNLIIRRSACGISMIVGHVPDGDTAYRLDPYRYPGMPAEDVTPPLEIRPFSAQNIRFENIDAEIETALLLIRLEEPGTRIADIGNLTLRNIRARCGAYPLILNPHGYRVHDIELSGITLDITGELWNRDSTPWPEFSGYFGFNHVENLMLNDFRVRKCEFPFAPEVQSDLRNGRIGLDEIMAQHASDRARCAARDDK